MSSYVWNAIRASAFAQLMAPTRELCVRRSALVCSGDAYRLVTCIAKYFLSHLFACGRAYSLDRCLIRPVRFECISTNA
ncbi:hypothetical protein CEXT_363941 [Caerostris extrusa]|uniref:Secreted protein n=1 Tax=Caerostris extrusa TaxID=172846 RepID=A0AAV4P035_CAEEX|nr:hypothetical protein CEXT_363941 [Caerostris extrusa]